MRSNWLAPNSYSIPTGGGKYLRRFCEQIISDGLVSAQKATQQEPPSLSQSRSFGSNQALLPDLNASNGFEFHVSYCGGSRPADPYLGRAARRLLTRSQAGLGTEGGTALCRSLLS